MEPQIISDETWKLVDGIWDKRVEEEVLAMQKAEFNEKQQLLLASHFL
ncbi:AAA-type ATPase family protein [Actinidia rufa]|uniref:AAA-type ATPase family protein n=1 Tax=Actinidia rufa TaxID=165716 RepID=A0A7J0EM23_9ERIC|nr:AAA-type ATPase family protein [Actinidia rufa]